MDHKIGLLVIVALMAFVAPVASAQYGPVVEISGLAGYTWSDGVSFDINSDYGDYNKIEPEDAFAWGLTAGYMLPYGTAIEFLYDRDATEISLAGLSGSKKIGDMSISNYHGLIVHNLIRPGSKVTPYIFGGLGATSYGEFSYTGSDGKTKTLDGETQFSTTWGAGLKIYAPQKPYGLKLQFRWTPTYIKTDATGYWCDPYWGCYTTGDAQYSNQIELNAGLTFRFPVGQ